MSLGRFLHAANCDVGRSFADDELTLKPLPPLSWARYPTEFTVSKNGKSHTGLVYYSHLALLKALKDFRPKSVMDVGCGEGVEAEMFRFCGADVFTVSADPQHAYKPNFFGDYMNANPGRFDLIWCAHTLEHVRNPGAFLDKIFNDLNDGGILVLTVPFNEFNSSSDSLTVGHINRYNFLLLCYQLICAGFDCSNISMRIYNAQISVIVKKIPNGIHRNNTAVYTDSFFPMGKKPGTGKMDLRSVRSVNWDRYHENGPLIKIGVSGWLRSMDARKFF